MQPGQVIRPEYIFEHVSVGIAMLDADDLHIRYMNSYLRSLLGEPWNYQDVTGQSVDKILSAPILKVVLPLLQRVAATGERIQHAEVPYEGFLETRGRTSWRITIERMPDLPQSELRQDGHPATPTLLITIEDV